MKEKEEREAIEELSVSLKALFSESPIGEVHPGENVMLVLSESSICTSKGDGLGMPQKRTSARLRMSPPYGCNAQRSSLVGRERRRGSQVRASVHGKIKTNSFPCDASECDDGCRTSC